MEFGAVAQTNPPAARVVALAQLAEQHSFDYFWTYDSHILWLEPYVIYSQILDRTSQIKVGTMVTNPATRDWTVTASTFATLNSMYGNRTVCGIGRGDSAVRVSGGSPVTLKTFRESIQVIRELANGRAATLNGSTIRFPWGQKSTLEMWVAAYGPLALKVAGELGDAFILQCGDPDIAEWMIRTVRAAAENVGRDPQSIKFCVAAPMYITDGTQAGLDHAREQCRWFGGMVGNHVADIVSKYGTDSDIPTALTDYIKGREGYDYNEHGKSGNTHVSFVPDEIVDRFCVIGTAEEHIERMRRYEELGVDQFAGYLDHDNKEETLRSYGAHVIPAMRAGQLAKS
ncbi:MULTISPECIES: TIGR03842 family LLM class F420-dependent oxidoreductase [unclassified Rathayibacter]|uniref:TIGR03842 family LLM class F420-dependent oxidoreductase n=1 Tax=unclassified Rathayibacter TaxID=2609250 RepID=UPI000CE8CB4D|nr:MULTISPECIES: TIGR03842 family LLM class F420-dependent oxidoreductase [unclassified Rathayibacter]PPG04759.1 TIGR03842 family LLM class F420-dependent oxidoreductase [Rathayibacter sp. AY2B1]PPG68456.1 TIGR03842 family LLM class F420-dependent oxidoreductase [Rathayibacter sp. AY1F4]